MIEHIYACWRWTGTVRDTGKDFGNEKDFKTDVFSSYILISNLWSRDLTVKNVFSHQTESEKPTKVREQEKNTPLSGLQKTDLASHLCNPWGMCAETNQ